MPSVINRTLLPLRLTAALVAALGIFPMAALIKWAPVVAWLPQAGREWLVSLAVFAVVCAYLARFAGERVDAFLSGARNALLAPTPRDFALFAALFTFFAALFVAWFSFGGQPAGGDEMAQRFQARILLAGRLWAVAEQPFKFFSGIQTVAVDGRWFAQFPIGGPLLLAAGSLFGAAWIVNPILAAWTSSSVYRFAARTTDETTARLATVLFATSPFVLLMSGSQMNHAGAVAFLMYGMVGLADWAHAAEPKALRSAALRIGFGFAASAAIRPYEAAVFGVIVGVFQLARARHSAAHARSLFWQLAGGALPVAFLLYVNAQQTGSPFLFGYDALNGASHRPGFHRDPTGVDFTPIQGIHHVSSYLLLLNASLFGGPIPSVLLIATALALATRATEWDNLIAALIVGLLIAFACYWAESFFVGPRFLYEAVPFFVIVVAGLPRSLAARLRSPRSVRAARLIVPLALVMTWALPPGIARFQGGWSQLVGERRGNDPRRIDLAAAAREAGLEDALVIVHESWHGRLTARLRALGAPALTAESMLRELDACGLQVALDAEDRTQGSPDSTRLHRVIRSALMFGDVKILPGTKGSTTLAFSPNRPLHPYCAPEMEVDESSVPLDWFLANERFDHDGRLAGAVVYVRDFGAENHKLLSRFADRTWYRYRPPAGPDDDRPVFVPYLNR
jgi:hypothetical protein